MEAVLELVILLRVLVEAVLEDSGLMQLMISQLQQLPYQALLLVTEVLVQLIIRTLVRLRLERMVAIQFFQPLPPQEAVVVHQEVYPPTLLETVVQAVVAFGQLLHTLGQEILLQQHPLKVMTEVMVQQVIMLVAVAVELVLLVLTLSHQLKLVLVVLEVRVIS